jgi:hypothetical protein
VVFEGFTGLNTLSPRAAIKDNECAWLDGYMPVGPNFIRIIPDVGPSLFTAPSGLTVVFYAFGNIKSTPIMVVFLSDGSLVQVNTNTGAVTPMGPSGTIENPSLTTMGTSQSGSSYIIIVSQQPNGYFLWDGINLYRNGTLGPSITIQSDGLDYTSVPSMTAVGGSGGGATFSATLQGNSLETISVTNPGSGYGPNDFAVIAFSGGGSPGVTATGVSNISGGSLIGVGITDPGAGYTSTATVTFLGGGGIGATGSVVVSGGSVAGIVPIEGGSGYTSPPTPFITDPNNPVAQANVQVMPSGISGTAVETYTGRVWVANGNLMTFTAPGSLTDFSPADGAGNFMSTDSFLRVSFVQPRQTNGFLYLINDSSVNYISGVTTTGTPPTTNFTNQNADPEIGSPYAPSIQVFSRNIVFANAFGIHVSYGGAVQKISDALNGIYNTVPNFGGFIPSSGKAIIYGQRVYVVLLPVIDLITGQQVNKLFLWNGKVWWSTQQSQNLTFIAAQEINSVLTTWGTNGTSIYPLFQNPSTLFTKTVQSKLFEAPGSVIIQKQTNRLWGLAYYYAFDGDGLNVSIDNEANSNLNNLIIGPQGIEWTNSIDQDVQWENSLGSPVGWGATGTLVTVFPPTAIAQNGTLLGFTVSTTASDMALVFLAMGVQEWQYRG